LDNTSRRCSPPKLHANAEGLLHIGLLSLLLSFAPPAIAQDVAREISSCTAWRECQAAALDAEARGDFETFHDLAWRTMQTRRAQDAEVMLMLARAQTRSGRPHDGLVMLRRIAELGVAPSEALTSETFARVRALPEWPQVEVLIAGVGRARSPSAPGDLAPSPTAPDQPRSPAQTAAPPPPRLAETATAVVPPSPTWVPETLVAVGVQNLVPAGLAYDRASGRVLVGNRTGRSVITISERLKTSMDLVRAASAGFQEVFAIAIDARQGDLWVASAAPEGSSPTNQPSAALHKLQLVSGRPLTTIPIDVGERPARFCGLAVARNGSVFVLDAAVSRLWRLAPGARVPALVGTLDLRAPTGVAVDDVGRHAYVAHETGLARVTLSGGSLADVSAPDGVNLAALEALTWHDASIVALERREADADRLVRLRLNRRATAVVGVDVLDPDVSTCGEPGAATVSGADVYYLAADGSAAKDKCSLVVRRLRIR
jgi:DNA-binding beta-propeller fold protein YncE